MQSVPRNNCVPAFCSGEVKKVKFLNYNINGLLQKIDNSHLIQYTTSHDFVCLTESFIATLFESDLFNDYCIYTAIAKKTISPRPLFGCWCHGPKAILTVCKTDFHWSWKYDRAKNRQRTSSHVKRCDARVFLHSSVWFRLLEKLSVRVWYRSFGAVHFGPTWLVWWFPYTVMRCFKCANSLWKLHGYSRRLSIFVICMIALFWMACVKGNMTTALPTLPVVVQVF